MIAKLTTILLVIFSFSSCRTCPKRPVIRELEVCSMNLEVTRCECFMYDYNTMKRTSEVYFQNKAYCYDLVGTHIADYFEFFKPWALKNINLYNSSCNH